MKRLTIINAAHLNRKSNVERERMLSLVKNRLDSDVILTEYSNHAKHITANAHGYDQIIAVGGDGTISEVIDGLHLQKHSLGIIPFGTGNGFAKHIMLKDINHAINVIERNNITLIDYIEVEYIQNNSIITRRCIATLSVGFVTRLIDLANKHLKWTGSFAYTLAGMICLFSGDSTFLKILKDNRHYKKNNILLGNIKYFGDYNLFPNAAINDGRINYLIGMTSRLGNLKQMMQIKMGKNNYSHYISGEVNTLDVIFEKPGKLMIDGEIICNVSKFTCKIIANGIKFCNPD